MPRRLRQIVRTCIQSERTDVVANWIANIVDAICVLFCGCAVLVVMALVIAIGFYAGAAMGGTWWAACCVLLAGGIFGFAWLDVSGDVDRQVDFWAGKR